MDVPVKYVLRGLALIIQLTLFISVSPVVHGQTVLDVRQRPVGSVVTVQGVALNGSELGIVRYIQDSTAGLAIYPGGNSPASFQQVTPGDLVSVTGVLTLFHGLLEINPVLSWQNLDSGVALPEAEKIRLSDLQFHDQGRLIRISCAGFMHTPAVFDGTHAFFTSQGEKGIVQIDNSNPLDGMAIPVGQVDLTGIVSYDNGFRFLLRNAQDIEQADCFHIRPAPQQSEITQDGFTVHWSASAPGAGLLFLKDESALRDTLFTGVMLPDQELSVTGLSAGTFYEVIAASVNTSGDTAMFPALLMATASGSSGDIKVYFTQSVNSGFSTGAHPDGTSFSEMLTSVTELISNARYTIDAAIYNSNRPDIISALEQAQQRGVRVRFIADGDQSNSALDPLPDFPVMFRLGDGIMHNKFLVADAEYTDLATIWTGSTNHSTNQLSWDPNNTVVIQDLALAKAYTIEFEEMWGGSGDTPNHTASRTGSDKADNVPHLFNIGGREVELYFSPSDRTNERISRAIHDAEYTVDVSLLLLTRYDLAAAMTSKAGEGLRVRVMVDDYESSAGPFQNLISGGVLAEHHDYSSIFHHKYAIVDEGYTDALLLTGSHNWTTSATTINDENTLIFHDPEIANIYRQEFEARWAEVFSSTVQEGLRNEISIFPNPVYDRIFIDANQPVREAVLTHASGVQVLSERVTDKQLDIPNLSPGIYVLELLMQDGRHLRFPFVKSK